MFVVIGDVIIRVDKQEGYKIKLNSFLIERVKLNEDKVY